MTETQHAPKSPKRRAAYVAAGVVGSLLAAGAVTAAVSQVGFDKGMRHMTVEAGHYGNMVQKARFFHKRPKTVEEAQDRAERMVKHFAIEIDANAEQTTKLVELARGVAGDVFPIRQSIKDARKEGLDLLGADTVDAAKIEALRAEQFGKIDAVSKRLTTALADAATVLNADQRKALVERVKEWRGRGGRHRGRGWGGRHEKRGWGHHRGWGGPERSDD